MEPRQANDQELKACTTFGNLVFQDAGTVIDFETALPKVYAPDSGRAHIHKIVTDASGAIKAMVALLPGQLHTTAGTLKTGYIGTVSVHPNNRREGLMKQLMA